MNENNGKNFFWLFVGLFVILFGFAGYNHASGKVQNITVPVDEMIESIVQNDAVISDIPSQEFPDESEIPEEFISFVRINKETSSSYKLIGDLLYMYNPNTGISSLTYMVNGSSVLLYDSSEGIQFSEETFAPFKEKTEQIYAQTL